MSNKFDGVYCMICGNKIPQGEDIQWLKGTGVRHINCGQIYDESESLKEKSLELFVQGKNPEAKKLYKKALMIQTTLVEDPDKSRIVSAEPQVMDKLDELSIPNEENLHTEFKSSWTHDYEVDKLQSTGQKNEAKERKQNASAYANLMKMESSTSVCAFLNGKGGSVWIGISDECKVLGIENDLKAFKRKGKREEDVFRQDISNYLFKYLKKRYLNEIEYQFHEIEDKKIFQISVKALEKSDRPAYMHEPKKIPYVREDEHDIPYNDPEQWNDYVKKRFPDSS
jgi:hypothetical protein